MFAVEILVVEYTCLGDWFVDKNHFFAVANTKESRKEEKYRCFLKNRDDDLYIGVSHTAECNTLISVENSPERLRITPGKCILFTIVVIHRSLIIGRQRNSCYFLFNAPFSKYT